MNYYICEIGFVFVAFLQSFFCDLNIILPRKDNKKHNYTYSTVLTIVNNYSDDITRIKQSEFC
jgi:hypothetical protein